MRMRLGAAIGFSAGYYFGAKAGRERYVELDRMLKKVRRSDTVDTATDKAKAVVDLTVERAKDAIDQHRHRDDSPLGEDVPAAPVYGLS